MKSCKKNGVPGYGQNYCADIAKKCEQKLQFIHFNCNFSATEQFAVFFYDVIS